MKSKANFRTVVSIDGIQFDTLADILPSEGNLDILFIAKTPAKLSVEIGHYFQGKQGIMFWNRLSEYNILKVPQGVFADERLLINKYGITDIVKVPRNYGNEPSDEEYRSGLQRILTVIERFKPKVIVFVYKKVVDNIIRLNFGLKLKSSYGFNLQLENYFDSKVFVFPMPGTPCNTKDAIKAMTDLKMFLRK